MLLNVPKNPWKKVGGMIVEGDAKVLPDAVVYKSICRMQGTGYKRGDLKNEAQNNMELIMLAPSMYRTLIAQFHLGWKIKNDYQSPKWVWVFETTHGGTVTTEDDGTPLPVWNQELIDIFEKEVKPHMS